MFCYCSLTFFGAQQKKIANVCITLNEYPYIRYYVAQHHQPLGPLKPHSSTRAPPPVPNSARWRTNLARGSEARAWEEAESEYATKVLAFTVQKNLDEHKKLNPEFAVKFLFKLSLAMPHETKSTLESTRITKTSSNSYYHRPLYGYVRSVYSRIHVSSHGQRFTSHRQWEIYVGCLRFHNNAVRV